MKCQNGVKRLLFTLQENKGFVLESGHIGLHVRREAGNLGNLHAAGALG